MMSGIVISLSIVLACTLALSAACRPGSDGTGEDYPSPTQSTNQNVYAPDNGPVPPHPFRRRRRDDNDNSALTSKWEAMTTMMKRLFDQLDADDDALVSIDEWVRRKGDAADYGHIVSEFDNNGDGQLSIDEFLAASNS